MKRAVVLLCALLSGCTFLFFQPERAYVLTPARLNLAYRDVYFTTVDHLRLHGWLLPAQGPPIATVLFLHGNGQNMSKQIFGVAWMPAYHLNVFLFDYRGYGNSQGTPSVAGAVTDAQAALKRTLTLPGVDPRRIVVYGQSLGGAIAIPAIARSPYRRYVRALVTEGAFASYRQMARYELRRFWPTWPLQYPLSFAISNRDRALDWVARISPIPLLIVQSVDDHIVPPRQGRELFARACPPKALWLVHGPHIEAFATAPARRHLVAWLRRRLAETPRAVTACERSADGR